MSLSPLIFSKLIDVIAVFLRLPRRLADKKSDSQPSDYSDKDLHSNYSKPRFSAKSQEVRSLSCSEIHLHSYGISDATKFSQGSSGSSTEPNSNNQENNVSKTCIGTNFPFSFGQTQCCSRPCSPGQTALTSSSDVPAVCLETSYSSSQSPDLDKRHDSISLIMWDKPHSIRDRDFYPSSRPRILPLYGCQSLRMGSSFRADNTVLSWSLDRKPVTAPYQYVRNDGHTISTETFIHHSCIMISTDNTTVVSYINKQGGTHSPNLCVEVCCCSRENPTTSVQNSSHSSVPATTTVVLRTSSSISVSSDSSATNSKTTDSIQKKICPSKPPNSRPSRLGVIKQSIRDKIFSQNVADFVSRSRRASTQKV